MKTRSVTAAVWTYLIALVVLCTPLNWVILSDPANESSQGWIVAMMFAPTGAALLTWLITKRKIIWGRPRVGNLMLALVPPLLVAVFYAVGTGFGVEFLGLGGINPLDLVFATLAGCLLAIGEEIGWRGMLLPLLRQRHGYFSANLLLAVIWAVFHLPIIILGGALYSNPGIPLWANVLFFTIAVFGFSFYVGWLWEKSHGIWSPTLAHAFWNHMLQSVLGAAFITLNAWLFFDEFGILPAAAMLLLFLIMVPGASRKYKSPLTAQSLSSTKVKK